MKVQLSRETCKTEVLPHHLLAMTTVPYYPPKVRARHSQEEKGQEQGFLNS